MMRPRRQDGFTLVELMGSLVILAVLGGALSSIARPMRSAGTAATGYVDDLAECRRAVRVLEQDLRPADRVENVASGVRIHEGAKNLDYTLLNGVLLRSVAGRTRTVARRIGSFAVRPVGGRVDVRVELQRRSHGRDAAAAVIHTSVCLRGRKR